jgi:DNA mismatch endonuclease (patch repair protein)
VTDAAQERTRARSEAPCTRVGESWASTPGVRSRMQQQRGRDTLPEIRLRRELHRLGLRFRLHLPLVPGAKLRKVDIAFSRARVAVFVDGCFWHGCERHGRRRHEVNHWYWPAKIQGNRERDRDTDDRLARAGWLVVRIWEHEDPEDAAERIALIVSQRV